MKKNLYIFGVGTTAKHVLDFVKRHDLYNVKSFIIDDKYKTQDQFEGLPVIELSKALTLIDKQEDALYIAISWNMLNSQRKEKYQYFKKLGFRLANLISPLASISSSITKDHIWIHDYCSIWYNSEIGCNTVIRPYALIAENTIVGDHCFIGVRSTVAGGCRLGEQCFLGISSTIFDERHIGKKCIIGAMCAIKRHLSDYSSVKFDSKNVIITHYAENEIESKLLYKNNVVS